MASNKRGGRRPVKQIKHGTVVGYAARCRCSPCRGAKSVQNRARRARKRVEGAGDKCGTHSGYTSGCRCDACRKAGSLYRRDRAARFAVDGVGYRCGSYVGYTSGCRCDACRWAMSVYQRNWVVNNPHEVRRKARRRYQTVRQAGGEKIDFQAIVKRDGGCCVLCGFPVPLAAKPGSALRGTCEHFLPVTRGGVTSYANCGLSHRSCNSSKGQLTLEEFRVREAALPVQRRVATRMAVLLSITSLDPPDRPRPDPKAS